ncbi:MAG: adenylate/guanylate cyclase domain-containing protein, partial [Acidimicrobiia bacterium]
ADLVALLDDVFTSFDSLVEERALEKIKTIGDAYMVASGVPVRRSDHAHVLCDLALAFLEELTNRSFRGERVTLRIGIHSGEVVAGIIGTKRFSYDLWGDAVNTASRMESGGSPGTIQITEQTKQLVEDAFVCESRGPVDVKGKGPMEVWHLKGRRPSSARV